MAIPVVASSKETAITTAVDPLTISSVEVAADEMVVLCLGGRDTGGGADGTIVSVKWGTEDMDVGKLETGLSAGYSGVYYLFPATPGTQDVVVEFNVDQSFCGGATLILTGADKADAVDATAGATISNNGTPSLAISTTQANTIIVASWFLNDPSSDSSIASTSGTIQEQSASGVAEIAASVTDAAAAQGYTETATLDDDPGTGDEDWIVAIVSFNELEFIKQVYARGRIRARWPRV